MTEPVTATVTEPVETPIQETATVTAPAKTKPKPKPLPKKAATIPAKSVKAAAATPAKAKSAKATSDKKTKRVRLFELLAKKPNGMTNPELLTALGTNSIATMCRDEACAKRLKILPKEDGDRGMRFALSALGLKALEGGTVDSKAPGKGSWE